MLMYFEKIGAKEPIILVALDEVIVTGEKRAIEVVQILKGFLDTFTPRFRLVATTFDDRLLVDGRTSSPYLHDGPMENWEVTGSKRSIVWLVLSPLNLDNPMRVVLKLNS